MDVVGSAEDRVACIVDVPSKPVSAPGRRHELHRSLRAGRARAAQLAELRLDEIYCCEHVPRHTEPTLRLPVVPQQLWCRARAADSDRVDSDRRRQSIQLALRSEKISADLPEIFRH